MEHLFLALLVIIMISALGSGFPVAFALPGSAIISIGLAALTGYIFEGDSSAYFAVDINRVYHGYFAECKYYQHSLPL